MTKIDVKITNGSTCSGIMLTHSDFWRATVIYIDKTTSNSRQKTFTDTHQLEATRQAAEWILNNIDAQAQIDFP